VDKISKKFIYWKDSGFIFTKNLISILPKDWRYNWLVPKSLGNEEWFKEANENVHLIEYPYSTSIHQNRYEFYGNVLKENFQYTKDIDVVINNQPEVSANLRVYFKNQRREDPPIFSFYHWIDCKESRQFADDLGGYFWRQLDGAINSEINYFHNEYAFNLFKKELLEKTNKDIWVNTGVFHPPHTSFGHMPVELPEEKIILFNHRLNNTTNWKFFLDVTDALWEKRKDFVVWFTDEGDKTKSNLIQREYVINKSLPFESYGFLMRNSHFSVCCHKGYSTWNMAVIDALGEGCFTIVPETEEVYKYMFGNCDPFMYHDNTKENLLSKMDSLLDYDFIPLKNKTTKILNSFGEYFSNESLYKIKDDIINAITRKAKSYKRLAKFEDVAEYIESRDRTTKKEFVNNFWTFHSNSNFQRIRWKLMVDKNIKDDIIEECSTYYKETDGSI
jgi:hypothetical protein